MQIFLAEVTYPCRLDGDTDEEWLDFITTFQPPFLTPHLRPPTGRPNCTHAYGEKAISIIPMLGKFGGRNEAKLVNNRLRNYTEIMV